MRFLPSSTNDEYTGSMLAAYFLTFFSVLAILPGCVHEFAPDGGAGHHPPEHYAVLIGLPLLIGALFLSLRTRAAKA